MKNQNLAAPSLDTRSWKTTGGDNLPLVTNGAHTHSLPGGHTLGHTLGHLEDNFSKVQWNTSLRAKVNFNASSMDATFNMGASLSSVRADLIQVNDSYPKTQVSGMVLELTSPIMLPVSLRVSLGSILDS